MNFYQSVDVVDILVIITFFFIVWFLTSFLWFWVRVRLLYLLSGVVKPAEFLGYLVEGLFKHDSLSYDQNHVSANEELTRQCRVHPLLPTSIAS